MSKTAVVQEPVLKAMSWRDAKALDQRLRKLQRLQAKINDIDDDDDYDKAEARLEGLWDNVQQAIARHVVDIPSSWLVDDAPAEIDWSSPDALEYIIAQKMRVLISLLTGREAAEEAKN